MLIKTDQATWDVCLIKTGPSSYVMDQCGLSKRQNRVKQPDWEYKQREFLKSLSVGNRNFILTGDPAFLFDPVPYTVVYNFSYADTIKRHTPRVLPQVQPTPQVPTPMPAPASQVPRPTPTSMPMPVVQIQEDEPDILDLPELEDNSNLASPDPPTLLQQPYQGKPLQQAILKSQLQAQIPDTLKRVIDKANLYKRT